MQDEEIIDLYFSRNETAITETSEKYGVKLHRLSANITENEADADECVNDTYMTAWRSIPPTRPQYLFAWLAKVTRSFSYKKWEKLHADKRNAVVTELTEEMSECIPSGENITYKIETQQLADTISAFLNKQDSSARFVFMRRYFWSDSIAAIASATSFSESKVKSILFRLRNRLKNELSKEGFTL